MRLLLVRAATVGAPNIVTTINTYTCRNGSKHFKDDCGCRNSSDSSNSSSSGNDLLPECGTCDATKESAWEASEATFGAVWASVSAPGTCR